MTAQPTTTADPDVAVVRAAFESFGAGDLAAFGRLLHPDGTWNHRNPDRLGGLHDGVEAILDFLRESVELTAATLRATAQAVMPDGAGHVCVLTRVSATRPDGRALDDAQILFITMQDGRIRSIEQYIGDPPAVTAFWA
jgi:ketosteroid isomerase-like protein